MITTQLKTAGSDQTQNVALNSSSRKSRIASAVSTGRSMGTK
jgi:hypothetical protein